MTILEDRKAALAAAQRVVDGAKGRDLTARENAAVEGHLAAVKDVDVKLEAIESGQKRLAQVNPGGNDIGDVPLEDYRPNYTPGQPARRTVAQLGGLTDTKARAMFTLARTGSAAIAELPGRKAYVGEASVSVPVALFENSAGGIYPTGGSLLDLFPHRTIEGPTVRVYRTLTAASVASVTAEGQPKPDAGLSVTYLDVSVTKIAAISKMSEELLSDYGSFFQFIGNEVAQAIKVRENAWGAALLLGTSGIQVYAATAGETVVDAVADGIATMQAAGINPTSVVMGPADMAKARKSKASTSGTYTFDPLTNGPAALFGLQTVVTPSLPLNTVLLGDFTQAGWVGVADPIKVELGYDGSDWSNNLRTLRVEERLLLAVPVPARIMKITLS